MSSKEIQKQQPLAPRRMFIQELLSTNDALAVRIMATVVAIPPQELVLDDGTATVTVVNHLAIKGAIGQTVDVIMKKCGMQYHATCIIWNVSPQNETLRRLELSYKGEMYLGYPCPKVSTQDVKMAIQHGGGLTVDDLVMLWNVSQEEIQSCLQELQLGGEIYCNREGHYVPL
jgi:hypothetical protein